MTHSELSVCEYLEDFVIETLVYNLKNFAKNVYLIYLYEVQFNKHTKTPCQKFNRYTTSETKTILVYQFFLMPSIRVSCPWAAANYYVLLTFNEAYNFIGLLVYFW